MKAQMSTLDDEKFTGRNAYDKKMHSGRCGSAAIRYESAYWGGKNSFDMIRMVATELNKSKRSDGDN